MIQGKKITDFITIVAIFLFLQYVFWYQYAVKEIGVFLTLIAVVMGCCILLRGIIDFGVFKAIAFVVAFVFVAFVSSSLLSNNSDYSISLCIRIIRYLIPLLAICFYINSSYKNMSIACFVFAISGLFLSIALFLTGTYNSVFSGYTIGDLNPNVYSSYILACMIGCLFLLNTVKKKTIRLFVIATVIIEFIAQIQAGSRRGILVFIIAVIMYLFALSRIKYEKSAISKIILSFGVISILFIVLYDFSVLLPGYENITQIFHSTVGDQLRDKYMMVALDIFRKHPILGQGLGSVSLAIGIYSHSLYFEILSSTGLVGFFVLFIPLIRIIRSCFRNIKGLCSNIEVRMQNATEIVAVSALLISGISVVFIYDAVFYILLALIISVNRILSFQ